ncbi:MAG: DUF4276 family protein [Bacteroidales bacterium]|jgi:hypothetical protein|nr:DUF4276 family protein [Bacteroidales bacterium]
MKRLIIICEGQTEQEFCKNILKEHFWDNFQIEIFTPIIKKSGGGIVKWNILKQQIQNHLKQESNAIVTTFIDLYKLKRDYPNYSTNNVDSIECGMSVEISENRFIPYIQKYEFECFVFCSIDVLKNNYKEAEVTDFSKIEDIIKRYPNPEDINNGIDTAPSKRIKQNIPAYDKINDGTILAIEMGLQNIRNKCLRFDYWLKKLEDL